MTAAEKEKKMQAIDERKGEVSESGFLLYLGLGTKKCYRAVSTPKACEYTESPDVLQVSGSTWGATQAEMYTQHILIHGVT